MTVEPPATSMEAQAATIRILLADDENLIRGAMATLALADASSSWRRPRPAPRRSPWPAPFGPTSGSSTCNCLTSTA